METLNISKTNIDKLSDNISKLTNLKEFSFEYTQIKALPSSMKYLSKI